MSAPRVLLVCSAGGHLLQLWALRAQVWSRSQHEWVCQPTPEAKALLHGESVTWAHGPTNRNIPNLLRNLWLAMRVLRRMRPHVVVSTGAGVAVPFLWLGRVLGAHTVYIESFARHKGLSLTGWLVYPVVHELIVQHAGLAARYKAARYYGSIY